MKKITIIITAVLAVLLIFTLCACDQKNDKKIVNFVIDGRIIDSVVTMGEEVVSLPTPPTKTGYTFAGWFFDKDIWEKPFDSQSLLQTKLEGSLAIYGKFDPIPCYFGHTKGESVAENTLASTCTESGSYEEVFYCTVCQTEIERREKTTAPLGHDIVHHDGSPATYISTGWTDYDTCTRCSYTTYTAIPRLVDENDASILASISFGNRGDNLLIGYYQANEENCDLTEEFIIGAEATIAFYQDGNCQTPINDITAIPIVAGNNVIYAKVISANKNNTNIYTLYLYKLSILTITFDTQGGEPIPPVTVQEGDMIQEPTPTKEGYIFLGWDFDFSKYILESATVTASWEINTHLPYTVEYYTQNLDNSYTLEESRILYGTYEESVQAEIKDIEYFSYYHAPSVLTGTIDGEGTTTLKVYYIRNLYKVNFEVNNAKAGTISSTGGEYRYGEKVSINITSTADGYTYLGWYTTTDTKLSEEDTYILTVEGDVSLIAKWYSESDKNYTVLYYRQNLEDDEYSIYESVTKQGATGEIVTAEIRTYEHYEYNQTRSAQTIEGTIKADGTTTLSVYYDCDIIHTTATVDDSKHGYIESYEQDKKYGATFSVTAVSNPGYIFDGWYIGSVRVWELLSLSYEVEKDYNLVAVWRPQTSTTYKVEYWLKNLNNDNYTKKKTIEYYGTTDTTADAKVLTFNHFTYDEGASEATASGTIAGDGSLLLKLYYSRDVYMVSTASENTEYGTVVALSEEYKYMKDFTIQVASVSQGYDFVGWYIEDELISDQTSYLVSANRNGVYTAKFSPRSDTPYTVEYYLQNLDDDEYTKQETLNEQGVTGSSILAVIKDYPHFTYSEEKSGGESMERIKGDGTSAYKIYYNRDVYNLTINNTAPDCGSVVSEGGNYKYGKQITVTAGQAKSGYKYAGWFEGNAKLTNEIDYTFTIDNNITLSVKWSPSNCTYYSIKYYQQNVSDNNYTLAEISEEQGVTDSLVTITPKEFNYFTYLPNHPDNITSATINGDGSTVFSLYYDRQLFSIAFDINGGTYVSGNILQQTRYGSTIIPPVVNPPEGFLFGQYDYDMEHAINNDVTVKFIWKSPVYTITYQYVVDLPNPNPTEYTVLLDTEDIIPLQPLANVTYYTFEGWEINGEMVTGIDTNKYKSNITITAVWDNVIFDCNEDGYITGLKSDYQALANFDFVTYAPYGVKGIAKNAFKDNTHIVNLTLPKTLEKVGDNAFEGCTALKTITFQTRESLLGDDVPDVATPSDFIEIGMAAFRFCTALESVSFPRNVVSKIGNNAFFQCTALKTVTFEKDNIFSDFSNVLPLTIGSKAFYYCKELLSINIPFRTTYIDESAFFKCEKLVDLTFDRTDNANATSFEPLVLNRSAFGRCTSLVSVTLPQGLSSLGAYCFEYCSALTSINVPATTRIIGRGAMTNTPWENSQPAGAVYLGNVLYKYNSTGGSNISLTVKNGTFSITDNCFNGCSELASITLPESLIAIGVNSFGYASYLTTVNFLGYNVESIGDSAFSECSRLSSFNLLTPAAVKSGKVKLQSIGLSAFTKTKLTEVALPSGCIIGKSSFECCYSLTTVSLPDTMTQIPDYAFYNCTNLKYINMPKSLTTIGNMAFKRTVLGDVDFPKTLTYIGKGAFEDSDITSATFHTTNITIDEYAFYYCSKMTSLIFPSGISIIGETPQEDVGELGVATFGLSAFSKCSKLATIKLPASLTSLPQNCFRSAYDLKEIELPVGITVLNRDVFCDCYDLTSVTLPNTLQVIGEGCFWANYKLTSLVIPDSVTTLTYNCFNSSGIKNIVIPNGVERIEEGVFARSDLQSITLSDSVKYIDRSAFEYCKQLTTINFGKNLISIGEYAFYDCNNLHSVTLPSKVVEIGNYAFQTCDNLYEVTLPASVERLGKGLFVNCNNMTYIHLEDTKGWYWVNDENDWLSSCNGQLLTLTETINVQEQMQSSTASQLNIGYYYHIREE